MLSSGGGNLQGPLHMLLALHVGEVGLGLQFRPGGPGLGRGDGLPARQMGHQLGHGLHGIDLNPLCQGGLRCRVRRYEKPLKPGLPGRQGHGQHAPDRAHLAGEAHFSHEGAARQVRLQLPGGL